MLDNRPGEEADYCRLLLKKLCAYRVLGVLRWFCCWVSV